MLKRIKVHLEPDLAEAAFRPSEAMDDVITDLTEALARLKALEEEIIEAPKFKPIKWCTEIAAIRGKLGGA